MALAACSKSSTGPLLGELYVANYDKNRFPMFNPAFIKAQHIRSMTGLSPEAKQKELFTFNQEGRPTSHIMLEASDTFDAEYYFYNAAGKLIRFKKSSGNFITEKYFFYDEEGHLDFIEEQLNYPNEVALSGRATLFSTTVYRYENGRCQSKANHRSEELDIYDYTERDLIASSLSTPLFKNEPDTLGLLQWRYNEESRLSQLDMLFVTSKDNRLNVRIIPAYDTEGRLLRLSRYNSAPSEEEAVYVGDFLFIYDEKGRLESIQMQEAEEAPRTVQYFEYKYY